MWQQLVDLIQMILVEVQSVDMFLRTYHVESMALYILTNSSALDVKIPRPT